MKSQIISTASVQNFFNDVKTNTISVDQFCNTRDVMLAKMVFSYEPLLKIVVDNY